MSGGLETRGVRAKASDRDPVAAYVWRLFERRMRLVAPCLSHEIFWGVPCGPTLSMVHPPRLVGILDTTPRAGEL